MSSYLTFLDMSAHARGGHYYSSNNHISGWEVLGFIVFVFLAMAIYQTAKLSLSTGGFFLNLGVLVGIGGILVACLFVGPIVVVVGIGICLYLGYHAINWWTERKQ